MKTARAIIDILFVEGERHQLIWLFLGILIMGLVEMVGIASIMPFLAVVTRPDVIHTNRYLSAVYVGLGFQSSQDFLFWSGLAVLVLLVVNSLVSAVTMWLLLRFTNLRGHAISQRVLENYLYQPYVFFLNRNSSEMAKTIVEEVNRFIAGVALQSVGLVTKTVVIVCILVLLIAVDPMMALTVIAALGAAYGVLFHSLRRKLDRIGRESFEAATDRVKLANEGVTGIKDLRILGREADHVRRFSRPSRLFAKHELTAQGLALLPRYALEAIAFSGVLLMVLYQLRAGKDAGTIIPLISLYAFAGYRLMPAAQTLFASVANIKYHLATIAVLRRDLALKTAERVDTLGPPIVPAHAITLESVTFGYPNAQRPILKDFTLTIPAHSTVGLVGSTGSGKTTTIDLLLGLLSPQQGRLMVDDLSIVASNVRRWHRSVGYVSQQMYLADDTIAQNVAFGVPKVDIDHAAVTRACELADLGGFVQSLPDRYQTIVGDRGVRLSGGQRQRIGIARALYVDPKVVVLDEATSAVDGATEAAIMDAMHLLAGRTLVIIAHRLSTVKECDVIYVLERGAIVGAGTYDELLHANPQFRKLANVG